MKNFYKRYCKLIFISLVVVGVLCFGNSVYALDVSLLTYNNLRVSIGKYSRAESVLTQGVSLETATLRDKVLFRFPKFENEKDKLIILIALITPEKFGTAFENPWGVAQALDHIFANWDEDKFQAFTTAITPEKFGTAFERDPSGVAQALDHIFANWGRVLKLAEIHRSDTDI